MDKTCSGIVEMGLMSLSLIPHQQKSVSFSGMLYGQVKVCEFTVCYPINNFREVFFNGFMIGQVLVEEFVKLFKNS
ncbi:hypothetical protein EB796_004375 [Bugula neritina]|uniref:Uncharacterized protein n=1 Tax=Bugula neritina TaxID=10212 RepID=A0A7J7KGC8_BUGNE|nr:hypothetical protein EB796_004375 [Bugula neritina]